MAALDPIDPGAGARAHGALLCNVDGQDLDPQHIARLGFFDVQRPGGRVVAPHVHAGKIPAILLQLAAVTILTLEPDGLPAVHPQRRRDRRVKGEMLACLHNRFHGKTPIKRSGCAACRSPARNRFPFQASAALGKALGRCGPHKAAFIYIIPPMLWQGKRFAKKRPLSPFVPQGFCLFWPKHSHCISTLPMVQLALTAERRVGSLPKGLPFHFTFSHPRKGCSP